jgi:glycosyltransferase involved in cell wall biosynthesis
MLLGCFFTRSIELEGVGSLALGLAEGFVQTGWEVDMLLPEGNYPAVAGASQVRFSGGLGKFRRALKEMSSRCEAVLLIENNPNLARTADASRCGDATWSLFVTPLQSLSLLGELGLGTQGLAHALSKHHLFARTIRWRGRRVIVASRYQARQLHALGADRVAVMPVCGRSRAQSIPNRQAARAQLGWDNRPVVGYLGHFSRAKGVDVLVDAFAGMEGSAVLALAHSGKGQFCQAGRLRLEELRRAGRLRQVGQTNPTTFLAACDVVALPYITSSVFHQPQVLLESLAAGTAVITTEVGGVGELIQPGGNGLLCPPGDVAALRGAMRQMLAQPAEAAEMGRQGRALFESRLAREVFCQEFDQLVTSG